MFLHYNLRNLKAHRVSDVGRASEFYFTYQVFSEDGDQSLLHQGFSRGCPIDTGYTLRAGYQRDLGDPKFTVRLPEVEGDETRRLTIDVYCWESDHSSDDVKKVFTNAAAEAVWKIYEANRERKSKARKEVLQWLENEDNELLSLALAAAPGVAPYAAIARAAVPLLKWLISEIRNNSDDLIGMSRTELFYAKKEGQYQYRWLVDDGVETWIDREQAPYYHEHRFHEASGDNLVSASVIYQTVFDAAEFLHN